MKSSKKNSLIYIGCIALLGIAIIVFLISKNNTQVANESTPLTESTDVVIEKASIGEEAQFFPYKSGDIDMELLAFKASDGSIRTAFNTCQVCYDSGYGYYVQEGDVLVCQNCGNRFPADSVGIEVGGCNPIPIMADNKVEDESTITISSAVIDEYSSYFEKWKN